MTTMRKKAMRKNVKEILDLVGEAERLADALCARDGFHLVGNEADEVRAACRSLLERALGDDGCSCALCGE